MDENKMDYERMANDIAEILIRKLNNTGENEMPNYNRTNIDDFLTVRGFGGYGGYGGGGYGGGGYGGHGGILREDTHADGTGRGENIKANRHAIYEGHNLLSREHGEIERNAQFHQLFEQIANSNMGAERRFGDLQRQLCDNALEALKCCCENKEAIALTRSDLTGLIKDTTIENLKSDKADNHNTAVLNALTQMGSAIAALAASNNDKHGRS